MRHIGSAVAERTVDAGKAVRASIAGVGVGLCRRIVIGPCPPFNAGAVAVCVVEDVLTRKAAGLPQGLRQAVRFSTSAAHVDGNHLYIRGLRIRFMCGPTLSDASACSISGK